VSWAEGVRRSIAWFQANPARMSIDDEHNAMLDTLIRLYN